MNRDIKPTLEDLYPDLTPEEQDKVERNLSQYVDLIKRIYKRFESEGKLKATFLKHQWLKRKHK
jgi:hypothetical protein